MTVQLTDDVHWINESYDLGGLYEHVAVYLVREGDRYVLIDSGSFHHREGIKREIEELTDGSGLDAMVLSHSDYPHSGNVSEFKDEWGDVELVASSGSPEIQGLPEATKCEIGGEMVIAGRRFSFIDPPLADRSHTTWIYDHGAEILFAADGFGNYHAADEADYTSAEFADGIPEERIYEFHRDNLVWLRYVDPEKLGAALEAIFDEYPVRFVAPIHGNPITGDDLDGYMDRLIESAGRIAGGYVVPE